jgi:hypothetical protein
MEKKAIVQFVCFVTNLETEEFAAKWEHFVKQFPDSSTGTTLQKADNAGKKTKYKYVSQHECETNNFRFAFMKDRSSEHFPEHTVKVVQAGGYMPVQIQCGHSDEEDDMKIMAFIDNNEADLGFYHRQTFRHLNIYEAYFENCMYSYVMEFFVHESGAPSLIQQLKTRTGVEVAIYKECPVLHISG